MEFVRSDVYFDPRAAIVVLRDQKRQIEPIVSRLMEATGSGPGSQMLAMLLQSLIAEGRPNLKDCVIEFMRFDYSRAAFEVGVSHPSLPEVPDGGARPRIEIPLSGERGMPEPNEVPLARGWP